MFFLSFNDPNSVQCRVAVVINYRFARNPRYLQDKVNYKIIYAYLTGVIFQYRIFTINKEFFFFFLVGYDEERPWWPIQSPNKDKVRKISKINKDDVEHKVLEVVNERDHCIH